MTIKKRHLFHVLLLLITTSGVAAEKQKKYDFDFYGFVRGDFFYNSRAASAPFNGALFLYPLDVNLDSDGQDLNATSNTGFYSFITRLGLDVAGPTIGSARTSAKIEMDFAGFSISNTMLRLRHAYVKLDWTHHSLLVGQTWHPLFASLSPTMNSLNVGAPIQPFSRTPQLNYAFKHSGWQITAAALWQLQFMSNGPDGKSINYQMYSNVPELYAGVHYAAKGWKVGAGANMLSIKPRCESRPNDSTVYKVNERMTSLSGEFYLEYTHKKFRVAAKTILGSAIDHTTVLGGYAVTERDSRTGEQQYTPFRHSATWLSLSYGITWKPIFYIGYSKNLGTSEPLLGTDLKYGTGLDIDQLAVANVGISYNRPHWMVSLEYVPSMAWYGTNRLADGRVIDTHSVTSHRITSVLTYYF